MADGRSRSTTCTEKLVEPEVLHLSTSDCAESRDHTCSSPLYSKKENNASDPQKNDFDTMAEPPARKTQETSNPLRTPKTRRRGVNSTSSTTDKKTSREDSAYSSTKGVQYNGSEGDDEIQAGQIKPRERIVVLRHKVLQTRQLRRRRRDEVRQFREDVREALDIFTRKINELVALGTLSDDVGPFYDKLRAALDKLGPAEDAYDNLERRLDWEEETLEQEEDSFYRHNTLFSLPVSESKADEVLSTFVKPSEVPEAEIQSPKLDDNPVQDYLDKVEEAYRLREDLEDLEDEYCKVADRTEVRRRHGIAVFEESTNLLKEYPKLRKDIIDQLQESEQTLRNLRHLCLQRGLFADAEYIYRPHDVLFEDIKEFLEEIRDRSPLHVAARHFDFPDHANDFSDKREYVNVWLFGWVQESPVDVLRLKNWICLMYPEVPSKSKDLDDSRWPDLALENWSKDSMGAMTSTFYNASRLDAIAGETGRLEATSSFRSGALDDIPEEEAETSIMESEAASYATHMLGEEKTPTKLDVPSSSPLQPSKSWPISPKSAGTKPSSNGPSNQVSQVPALMPDPSSEAPKGEIIIFNPAVTKRVSLPSFPRPNSDSLSWWT